MGIKKLRRLNLTAPLPEIRRINHEIAEWNGCLRKVSYETEKLAEREVKNQRRSFGKKMESYLCPHCSRFHLTKSSEEKS